MTFMNSPVITYPILVSNFSIILTARGIEYLAAVSLFQGKPVILPQSVTAPEE